MTHKRNMDFVKNMLGINKDVDIYDQICRACVDTNANPVEVFEKMMSPEDIDDLNEGKTPFDSLVCHVKAWCEMGKPNQNE